MTASKLPENGSQQFPYLSTPNRLILSNSPDLKTLFCKRLQAKRPSGNRQTSVLSCGVPPISHRNTDFIEDLTILRSKRASLEALWQ